MTKGRLTVDVSDRQRVYDDSVDILRLYASGLGTTTIAKMKHTTLAIIRGVLRTNSVPERSRREGMIERMARTRPEERVRLVANAREQRLENLRTASHDPTSLNPAVGYGYHLIAERIVSEGLTVYRQEKLGPYYLDLVVDHLIVESVLHFNNLPTRTSKRLKYLLETDRSVIYVAFSSVEALLSHLDDVITDLKLVRDNPPMLSEYRVIRCDLKRGIAKDNYDKWAFIHGTKGSKYTVSWPNQG